MPDTEKVIKELHSALESVAEDDNPNGSVAVKIWAIRDCLELIEKYDDMIPITTIAELLVDWATPPMNEERWWLLMMCERFLLDLKGRKNRND